MTLRQLIDKAIFIGRQVSGCDNIPVIYQGASDDLSTLELKQDNNGKLWVSLT